jgi:membrane-associated HD superfamily phosphohydrolase
MFSLSKYVFKDNEIFPEKQCLLRIKLDGPHTADIIKLLDRYSTFINDIESLDDDISGKSDLSKDSLKYQLIHLHDKTSLERRTKPIMQLICGKNINFDKDKMEDSVDKISKAGITEENKNQLKTNINDFFNKNPLEAIQDPQILGIMKDIMTELK